VNNTVKDLENLILSVHRRNGGTLSELDWHCRLLDPQLRLDSLDLAEILVAVEKKYGFSPFDCPTPPKTWADVASLINGRTTEGRG
jgi:hypothetical protein